MRDLSVFRRLQGMAEKKGSTVDVCSHVSEHSVGKIGLMNDHYFMNLVFES